MERLPKFDIVRDIKAIQDGGFFCQACLVGKDKAAISPLFRNMGTYVSLGEVIQRKDSICKECRDTNEKLVRQQRRSSRGDGNGYEMEAQRLLASKLADEGTEE